MDKLSKASVHYQNEPHGQRRCDRCTMFIQPRGCTLVMGVIQPYGYCVEYDPKQPAADKRKRRVA